MLFKYLFRKKPKKGSLQDFWQFTEIKDGVIAMKDGKYRIGLEIFPVNFFLMDDSEKLNSIHGFEEVLRTLDDNFSFRILIQTRKTTIDDYVDTIEKVYSIKNDVKRHSIFEKYKQYLQSYCADNDILSKRFYFIIESSSAKFTLPKDVKSKDEKDAQGTSSGQIKADLINLATNLQSLFASINLSSTVMTTGDIIRVAMTLINEPEYEANKAQYRKIDEIREEAEKNKLPFNIVDYISPEYIKADNIDCLNIDGTTDIRMHYISGLGSTARIDWFNDIINFAKNFDFMLTFTSRDSSEVLGITTDKRRRLEGKIMFDERDMKPKNVADEIALESMISIENDYMRSKIKAIDVSLDIAFRGKNLQTINQAYAQMNKLLKTKLMRMRVYLHDQFQALQGMFVAGESRVFEKATLDINTEVAAYMFPFVSPQVSSNSGILYGIDKSSNSLVLIDRKELESYNRSIIAQTGAGKSYFIKLDLIRSTMIGYQSFVLDLENEFEAVTDYLDGKYIELSKDGAYFINPFLIFSEEHRALKVEFVTNLFDILAGKRAPEVERVVIEERVGKVYDRVLKDGSQPLLRDFIDELKIGEQGKYLKDLIQILESYAKPTHAQYFLFNKEQNLDYRTDKVITFALKNIDKKELIIPIILESYWYHINLTKNTPTFKNLIIDEASQLFNSELIAERLSMLAKRGRKYNSGITTIVQSINHYYETRNNFAPDLFDQSSITLVMKHKIADSFDKLNEKIHINGPERSYLEKLEVGNGLLIVNNSKIPLKIVSSQEEGMISSTKPPSAHNT